jgi:threonyl-tRNA synthetase
MASLLLEIQQLEEKLAQLKVAAAAEGGAAAPGDGGEAVSRAGGHAAGHAGHAGRDKTRLNAANDTKLMMGGSKIGGAFAGDKTFLDARLAVFDKIKARTAARVAAKTKRAMTVTMPDGKKTFEATTWETTPLAIAKLLSNSLAKTAVVARVTYTGERVDEDVLNVVDDDGLGEEADEGGDDGGGAGDDATGPANAILWDMTRPLEGDCIVEILTFADPEGKTALWHSSAHMLGQALENCFGAKLTIGPPVEGGFYYDSFVGAEVCTEKTWYPKLEGEIKKIIKEKQTFERMVVTKDDLLELFNDNPFKQAIITTKVPDGSLTTVYRNGKFVDLCMGPHIPNTSLAKAFAISKHSATYWCGKETGDSLQRVYGIAFADTRKEKANNAKKKWEKEMQMRRDGDHRKVGPAQGLFFMHDLTPGSAFFLPHGARVYNTLVDFIKAEYWKRGYDEVVSPNIFSTDLWKISGHYYKYADDMFLFNTKDDVEFAMKPMNCPGHCLMFRHLQGAMSHSKLPIRMADFGVLHRNERSGALGGLTRVRRFQQDDAHIFCRPDQVKDEVIGALEFMRDVYKIFGMSFSLMRSTRPESAIGVDTDAGVARWDAAEFALTGALDEFAGPGNWKDDKGGGAFYGPKIDIKVRDCMGRQFQCATVQLDFQLPIRFDLKYARAGAGEGKADGAAAGAGEVATGAAGEAKKQDEKKNKIYKNLPNSVAEVPAGYERPVMVHRAMLGSVERMFAILVEHFGGNWPLWLSPRQVMIVPVHRDFEDYACTLRDRLRAEGIFVDVDLTRRTMKKSIREAQVQGKYNYICVVGRDEMEKDVVSARARGQETEMRGIPTADFIKDLLDKIRTKAADPPPEEKKAKGGNSEKAGKGGDKGKKEGAAAAADQSCWTKTEIKVGQIVKAWAHPDSEKVSLREKRGGLLFLSCSSGASFCCCVVLLLL